MILMTASVLLCITQRRIILLRYYNDILRLHFGMIHADSLIEIPSHCLVLLFAMPYKQIVFTLVLIDIGRGRRKKLGRGALVNKYCISAATARYILNILK